MINKLSTKTKLCFASTDVFGGGSFNIINFIFPAYAAIQLGLGAATAGLIMLIARIWDAISDPLMGQISDRTKPNRFGKRRLYIFIGSIFVIPVTLLLFYPYTAGVTGNFILSLLSYIAFTTVQTMIMIPYFSLASEISSDYTQRAKAASFRLTFSLISSIVCVAVPKLIIDMLRSPTGDASTGYIVMALVFGTIFALPMLFTVFGVKEEIITKPTETKLNLKDFVKPLASKSVRKYIAMQVSVGAASGALTSLFFFYVDFCLKGNLTAIGQGNILGLIAAALMFGMQVIALPVYLKIIAKRDKATIYRWGAFLWIAAMWSLLLIGFNISGGMDIVVILIAAIAGLGICGPMMVPHVTIGDINDAYELEFNVRVEGAVSGICNFTNKTASAIAVASVMALVELFGFVGPKAGESSLGLIQPLSAQTAMMWIIILAPMAFLATGIIVSYTYRINAAKQTQIRRLIDLQRQGIDVSQEKQSLLQTL